MEGICENVIFGGGDDGCLYFWSSWDLSFLLKLKGHQASISAISIKYVFVCFLNSYYHVKKYVLFIILFI